MSSMDGVVARVDLEGSGLKSPLLVVGTPGNSQNTARAQVGTPTSRQAVNSRYINKQAVNSRMKVMESAHEHAKKTMIEQKRDQRRYYAPPTREEDEAWYRCVSQQTAKAVYQRKLTKQGVSVKNTYAPLDVGYYQKSKDNASVRPFLELPMYKCPVTPPKRRTKKVKVVNRVKDRKGAVTEYYTVLPKKVNTAVVEEYSKKLEKVVETEKHKSELKERKQKFEDKYQHLQIFAQSHDDWEHEVDEAPWASTKMHNIKPKDNPLEGFTPEQIEHLRWNPKDDNSDFSASDSESDDDDICVQSGWEEASNYLMSGAFTGPKIAKPVLKHIERLFTTITLMYGAKSWPFALLQVHSYLSTTFEYSVAAEAYQVIHDIWDNSTKAKFDRDVSESDLWEQVCKKVDHLKYGTEDEHNQEETDRIFETVRLQKEAYDYLERTREDLWPDIKVQGAKEFVEKIKGVSFVGCMDSFKMCFRDFQAVSGSEFVKRLKKMVAYVVALGLCEVEKIPLSHIRFEEYYKTSGIGDLHWSEIWTGIIDTFLYVYEAGVSIFKGESYMDVIGTSRGATNFEVKYTKVVGNIGLYEDEKLELVNMTEHQYEKWLDELEENIKRLHSRLNGPEKNIASIKMKELAKIRARVVTTQQSMPMREAPFTFYLFGGPGVGKSVVLSPVIKFLMVINGLGSDEADIAHLRLDEAYQSELKSRHTVIVVDDIGNTLVNLEKGCTGQALIDYNNNNPRHALKADVDSKGKVLIKPKIFALTGNTSDIQAGMRSNEPLSLVRRLGVRITQSVKTGWKVKDSNMIDPSKMINLVEDAWDFTVEKPVPTSNPIDEPGHTRYDWKVQEFEGKKLDKVDMETLLKYLAVVSKEHFAHQRRLMVNAKALQDLKLCEHEMFSSVCSKCQAQEALEAIERMNAEEPQLETQSGEDLYALLKRTRDWSYTAVEWVPESIKDNRVVNHVYTRLSALGRLESGVTGMRVFSFIGGTFGIMTASLFAATTPVVLFMGAFLSMASYTALAVMQAHRALKRLKNVTFTTLQPLVAHKYKYVWGGALGAAGVVAAIVLALKLFRPHAKKVGDEYIEELTKPNKCEDGTDCPTCGLERKLLCEPCDAKCEKNKGRWWAPGATCDREDCSSVDDGLYLQPKPQMGHIPQPDAVQKENVYVVPNIEPIKVRHRLATMKEEHMVNVVKRSVAFARFHVPGENLHSVCDIFPLKGNVWIAPYHMLRRGCDKVEVIRSEGQLNNNRECLITEGCWKRIGTTDLCVICLVTVGEVLDTTEFFMDGEFPRQQQSLRWIYKNRKAEIVEDAFMARFSMVELRDNDGERLVYPGWHYIMNQNTQEGFCMGVLISRGKVPYILGFHSAGDSKNGHGRGHFITSQELQLAYTNLMKREVGDAVNINVQVASQGDMVLDFPKYNIKALGVLHEKSPFNFHSEPGHVEIFGAHTGSRMRYKSQCVPTYISEAVAEHCGVERMHGPPKNMNSWKPWRADLEAVLPCKQLDPTFLGKAFANLEKRYIKLFTKMTPEQKENIKPLGITANLSGVDGVYGIDPVKLKTSAGFPRCTPKRNLIHELNEVVDGITRPLYVDAEVEDNMAKIEDTLAQGYRVYCKFKTSLKDEPTKLTKDKVRTFAGADLELLLEIRKYFLPIAKVMMDNPEYFACAVGVNAQGKDWSKLARHLTRFGKKRTIAGDYGAFDSRMMNQMVLLAFMILIGCAQALGWSERDLAIMTGLATEVAHGVCDYNGEYVLWHGQNLSGQAMTVFINNTVNELYVGFTYYFAYHMLLNPDSDHNQKFNDYLGEMSGTEDVHERIAFATSWRGKFFYLTEEMKTKEKCPSPHEMISLLCYGDDNNMSVSEECTWFNHTVMAGVLSQFGVKYTMADKNAPSVPFIDFEDSTFLKRRFVWDEKLQNYLAPLEMASLYKTLHACLRSKFLTEQEQAAEALMSVNRELFFHGKEVFEEWRPKLHKVIEATNLGSYFAGGCLPGYQYYETEYVIKNDVQIKPELSGVVVENSTCHLETRALGIEAVLPDVKAFGEYTQVMVQSRDERILLYNINSGEERSNERITSYRVGQSEMIHKDETVVFRDGVEQWESAIKSGWDATRDVAMMDAPSYEEFFARPVIYNIGTWTVNNAVQFGASFNPWSVFLEDKRVVNRLSNFNLTQATLKVKFLINGNAFYYGRLMAEYLPLDAFNSIDTLTVSNKNVLIQASQRLKLFLNPTTSQGGILHLPFLWHKNALDLVIPDCEAMGRIYIREINQLKHANAGTDPVTLQAYIWSEDLRLSVPTTNDAFNIAPQAGDEYGDSPVSAMANSVAKAAGKLEGVPVIGQYAKATQMVASGMGAIAKSFGYSRPPIIEAPVNMRQKPIGNLVNTNVPDPVTKLTVDAKQEVTIDPSVLGIDVPDEMVIKEIASRETYITQFNWPISAARGSLLWNTAVLPTMCVVDSSFTNPMTWYTSTGFAALPFKWWRGTMRYRFQIVCSEYHKGRIRLVYDPKIIVSADRNIVQSRIVDLTTERDFVMDVSWGQPVPFAQVDNGYSSFGSVLITAFIPTSNGTLGLYVENDLTSPNTTVNNDIKINVFVSACDDFEVAVPTEDYISSLTYSVQSGVEIAVQSSDEPALDTDNAPVKEQPDEEVMSCLVVDHTYDVLFGESIQSFRQMVKRYNYHSSVLLPVAVAGRYNWVLVDRDFPRYRGKWSDAIDPPVTGVTNINNAKNTLINYLTPAYVGYRGGLRWKYMYHTDNVSGADYQWVFRVNADGIPYANIQSAIDFTPATFSKNRSQSLFSLHAGSEITQTRLQPTLEIETPYYLPYRFSHAKQIGTHPYPTAPNETSLSHALHTDVTITANAYYDRFVAGAEDFSLFLYNGMPPVRTIDLSA